MPTTETPTTAHRQQIDRLHRKLATADHWIPILRRARALVSLTENPHLRRVYLDAIDSGGEILPVRRTSQTNEDGTFELKETPQFAACPKLRAAQELLADWDGAGLEELKARAEELRAQIAAMEATGPPQPAAPPSPRNFDTQATPPPRTPARSFQGAA